MLDVKMMSVAGVRSPVFDSGPHKSGQAVVFVHGNPGPLEDWEVLAPAVAQLARVIAMDLPGFGRADHPAHFDFTIEGYARHLGGLLEQLGVGRVHLVLHDFGGAWGARWALDHPEQLASLTLINTPLSGDFVWHFWAKLWQLPWLGELQHFLAGPRAIGYVMNRDNPRPFPPAFIDRITSVNDWNQKMGVTKLYRACKDARASFGPLAEGLKALDPPACLIWGAADVYAPVRYAEQQAALFTNRELHLLDGLGHWPFIDDPARVSVPLSRFLERQLSATSEASRSPGPAGATSK